MRCSSTLRMHHRSFYYISAAFNLMEKLRVVHLKHFVYYHYITCYRSCQRDSVVKFCNNFHSYSPIETSSDYKATYQYYVVSNVLTYLFYQRSLTTHFFYLARVHHHTTTSSPPRQRKKVEESSKQRKEKYWRVRPPILSKKTPNFVAKSKLR